MTNVPEPPLPPVNPLACPPPNLQASSALQAVVRKLAVKAVRKAVRAAHQNVQTAYLAVSVSQAEALIQLDCMLPPPHLSHLLAQHNADQLSAIGGMMQGVGVRMYLVQLADNSRCVGSNWVGQLEADADTYRVLLPGQGGILYGPLKTC